MSEKQQVLIRFSLARRLEHILLIASFTTLAITGIPQKYASAGISQAILALFGGIELTRIIHRTAATIFLLETVYHLVVMFYQLYVQRKSASMGISIQDAKDGIQALGYNLGLTKLRPRMSRYTFDEKMEYWAMIWGLVLMTLTGFMLWNPIATTSALPGQFIPAAKVAHGGEAVLAVLAILVWHMYHVHLKRFNKSIWTGKITRDEMEEDHPLELEHLDEGVEEVQPHKLLDRRRKIFIPIAGIFSLLLLFGIYRFITIEKTAIETVPPPPESSEPIFQPQATPTIAALPTAEATAPAALVSAATTWDAGIGTLFEQKCGACHGAAGGLNLQSYTSAMQGGGQGPVILAGDSANSLLVKLQISGSHPGLFSADELSKITEWIDAGAPEK